METQVKNTTTETRTIESTIDIDNEWLSPITIKYDFVTVYDALGLFGITVTDISYEISFFTDTPEEIILDQVKEIIREENYGITIDFAI